MNQKIIKTIRFILCIILVILIIMLINTHQKNKTQNNNEERDKGIKIKSELTDYIVEAHINNYFQGRDGNKICKITVHHMAAPLSAQNCGKIFQKEEKQASSNYGIGNDGEIACYVGEENTSRASTSKINDSQAITIEVANCGMEPNYPISDEAWDALVRLCIDICKRYKFKLEYDGTEKGSLTSHNMFTNTECPGPYLTSRLEELADTVNAQL